MRRARLLSLAVASLLAACGEDANTSAHTDVRDGQVSDASTLVDSPANDASLVYTFPCLGEREATNEATFASVYLDIFCHASCTNPYCHGSSGAWAELDLASSIEVAYANLVGHRAGTSVPADGRATCRNSDLLRVVAGSPEQSLLYLKITGHAPCGTQMPPPDSDFSPLTAAQIDQIRRWIEAGAPLHLSSDAGVSRGDAGTDASL